VHGETRPYKDIRHKTSRVKAVSNTSTVALRVVEGDEKGSLESETVKYGRRVPRDLDPRMTALARAGSNCKRQAHPLIRESAPQQEICNCLTVMKILGAL
jgi:hypothetical protein